MKEIKQFRGGGLDTDSAYEDIAPNDVAGGYNVRFTGTEGGEEGYATDIESNRLISGSLPAGINKTIGAFGFETIRKGYTFLCNSFGNHQIREYDYDSQTETVLFTNKTDSAGIDILPLNPQHYITDLKLLQGTTAIFTDSNEEVYSINLTRLKSGELGVITKDDIRLIKAPSLTSPTAYFCDDQSRSVNLLKGNLFQFAVQYVYLDGEASAWSCYSKRPVNPAESTPVEGTDVGKANNLAVSVNIGSNRVKTINVGARIGLYDFMLIKSISRAEVTAIQSETFPAEDGTFAPYDPSVSGVYEVYNPTTNTYSFAFYNDGLYSNIDVLETDLNYDHIPEQVGTIELLNGNVLALADLTEGKPRPVVDVSLTTTTRNPDINIILEPDNTRLKVDRFTEQQEGGSDPFYRYYIFFSGIAQTGDQITLVTKKHTGETLNSITVPATITEDENTLKLVQKLAVSLPYPTNVITVGSQVRLMFSARRLSETGGDYREKMLTAPKVTLALAGTGQSKSIPAIKDNSSYQLALQFKDRYGRLFPIVTDSRFILKTQSLAQMEGQIPRFTWAINSTIAPIGAESYQWLISKNTTHESNLFVNAVLDTTNTDADYLVFKLNSLNKFNENNKSSILSYDYTAGDRCTFVSMQPATGDKIWFNDPKVVDVEVVDYSTKKTSTDPDPVVIDYLLKVRKSSVIDDDNEYGGQTIEGRDLLLELYTPTKRASTAEGKTTYNSTLFYEIGEEYPVNNGSYTQVTGEIDSADVYYKTRQLVNATDDSDLNVYEVMDFNFSDFYQSDYTNYGRARTFEDETGVKRKKSSIRYSDMALADSLTNGISRFFSERIYGENSGQTSSNYGAINKIHQRDNYLIVIQETKVGHAPVYAHILEDNEGAQNVAISDKILGAIRYIQSGSYGMGNAKESFAVSSKGVVYFVDPNNSIPVRDGFDGVKEIGGKLSRHWKSVIHQANKAGKKFIGMFDEANQEYILSIEGVGDIVTTIVFDEAQWSFTNNYTINPATLAITGSLHGTTTVNTTTGIATFTPTADYVGTAGFSFSFVDNGVVVNKNACGVIEAGSKVVDDFVFSDLTGVEPSTLYESNAILINANDIPSPISVVGGQYSINGSAWTSVAGTVVEGDSVIVRGTSSATSLGTVNVVLTVFDKSDTFSIQTKSIVFVPVSYSVDYGVDPITQNGLIFTKNGTEVARFGSEGSGTLSATFTEGDVLGIRQFSYYGAFPWEATSNANLTVTVGGVERYNDNETVQATELQADSFTIGVGSGTISATATGTSSASGYVTKFLNVTSNTATGRLRVTDTTPPKEVLYISDSETGSHTYPYNLFVDGNTQTLRVENQSASATISVVVNSSSPVVIGVSTYHDFTAITKDSINVTITQ